MQSLYQVDQEIERLCCQVDPETGEPIYNESDLDALLVKRAEAVEDLALVVKNTKAEAEMIRAEIDALSRRVKQLDRQNENAKKYLKYGLHGEKLKTSKVRVSYRTTEKTVLEDNFIKWAEDYGKDYFLRYKQPEADKEAIRRAIKDGENIPFAHLEQSTSIIVS